jgi:hypothetical protein
VWQRLLDLRSRIARSDEQHLLSRIDADLTYLRALLGERQAISDYVQLTQGCPARGWPEEHIQRVAEKVRSRLAAQGIEWGAETLLQLEEAEGLLEPDVAIEVIRSQAEGLEPTIRKVTGSDAAYDLSIVSVDVDEYWSYWLDGEGMRVRMRINLRRARFTSVRARQFAAHEILGHALQYSSLAAHCAAEDVPWVRVLSVHAQHQVLFEGVGQTLPLLALPADDAVATRIYLDHYLELVRAEIHLGINAGTSVQDCVERARRRVPFWTGGDVADALGDRSANPLLRSYLWAYPAGIDWFVALAESGRGAVPAVMQAAYRNPLSPQDLANLWPEGPPIGGPGSAQRERARRSR